MVMNQPEVKAKHMLSATVHIFRIYFFIVRYRHINIYTPLGISNVSLTVLHKRHLCPTLGLLGSAHLR